MKKNPINRIVVLMMENQSFDRLLGFAKGEEALRGTHTLFQYFGCVSHRDIVLVHKDMRKSPAVRLMMDAVTE